MRPGKVLILVWPEASEYNATLHLARLLRQRGSDVVYAAPGRWEAYLTRQRFPTLSLDPSASVLTDAAGRCRLSSVRAEARKRIDELQASLTGLGCRAFDLVLLQPTLWLYGLALHGLGIPYLLVSGCLGSPRSSDIPPVFSDLVPLPGHPLANRVRCLWAWSALRYLGAFGHRYRGIIQPRESTGRARLRDAGVAARHLFHSVLEPLYMPVYYRVLRVARREGMVVRWGDYGHRLTSTEIVLGPEGVDFPRPLRRYHRVYAGACVDTERVEDTFDRSGIDPGKPLVYCAVGSHGGYWNAENRSRLLRCVVESFRARPYYQLLLQTIGDDECRACGPLPANILAARWYPQLQVLSAASLIITHGGFGTVREALFFGVPMIVFPCGVDQTGNAARLVQLRVGLAGDIRTVTPATMSRMLREIEMPPYRENALRLRSALRADNTCSAALTIIEGTLKGAVDDAMVGRVCGPTCR
jgi:zeaxanthin glucosyltransferase